MTLFTCLMSYTKTYPKRKLARKNFTVEYIFTDITQILYILLKNHTYKSYLFIFYLIQYCPGIFVLDYFMETIKQSQEFGFCGGGRVRLPQYYTHPQLGIITVVEHILAGFVFLQHLTHVRYTIIYFSCYP